MRKTLTLDDDVAAQLERLRRMRNMTLTKLVNEALRCVQSSFHLGERQNEPIRRKRNDFRWSR